MRDRQNSSRPGGLSNSGRNKPERRTKPKQRMTGFSQGVANRLIAPGEIQSESLEVPQIGKAMAKRVIDHEMPGSCDRPSLFRQVRNLATNETEACLYAVLVQDNEEVIGNLPRGAVVECEHAVARCQRAPFARNKNGIGRHAADARWDQRNRRQKGGLQGAVAQSEHR